MSSVTSVVNLVQSQVYHTERPPLFAGICHDGPHCTGSLVHQWLLILLHYTLPQKWGQNLNHLNTYRNSTEVHIIPITTQTTIYLSFDLHFSLTSISMYTFVQIWLPELATYLVLVGVCVLLECVVTFRMSCRPREMYCGHARLGCLSVHGRCLQYCMDPDVTWRSGRGCPLVVHCWADLQSVHGLRCYGNTMEMRGRAQR